MILNKTIGIDASSLGSGGAKRHLIELLKNFEHTNYNFSKIKIWGGDKLLSSIPNYHWLQKYPQPFLDKNIFYKIYWQIFVKDNLFIKSDICILFCPFGTYIGKFKPYISMSRNMLIFDKIEKNRFNFFSIMRIKLITLFYVQKKSFRNAKGIIFISNYAQKTISNIIDLSQVKQKVINHGVSNSFQFPPRVIKNDNSKMFKFLYISSIWPYKHHLNVVKTIDKLHKTGYNIELDIVGAPDHYKTSKRLEHELNEDNKRDFIFWHQNVGLDDVANFYKNADAFIFASTCENMPNILIEAMASGLPICCSNFKPMPEFIEDAAIYFDPTNPLSIESAILILLQDCSLRNKISSKSFNLSKRYTWEKCAIETFNFINKTINNNE